jgi:hypothetical protein
MAGRDTDEANAKAQVWLDRTVSLCDGDRGRGDGRRMVGRAGGRLTGNESLVGNLIRAALLDDWMRLVDTFICYPRPHMLHEI